MEIEDSNVPSLTLNIVIHIHNHIMKQTKMEGVTEQHLPKIDDSVIRPAGEHR